MELFGSQRPDALFVASDEQALGALRALSELGLRCPDDVAVASFDGIAPAAYAVPALTTMAQPFAGLGQHAIALLTARLIDPATRAEVSVLPVEILTRGSCGCVDKPGEIQDPKRPARTQRKPMSTQ